MSQFEQQTTKTFRIAISLVVSVFVFGLIGFLLSMNLNLIIVSRTSEIGSDIKLRRAGATNVIMPERIGGQRMARLVTQPDVVDFMEYILLQRNRDVSIHEVHCREIAAINQGKTIGELNLGIVTGTTIIGLKNREGRYVFNPGSDYAVGIHDQLFVLGSPEQVRNFNNFLEDKM